MSTCRQIGMAYGPIPWTAVQMFADANGFSPGMADTLSTLITSMDGVYMKWVSDELARKKEH